MSAIDVDENRAILFHAPSHVGLLKVSYLLPEHPDLTDEDNAYSSWCRRICGHSVYKVATDRWVSSFHYLLPIPFPPPHAIMSARSDSISASAAGGMSVETHYPRTVRNKPSRRAWVEPAALPDYGDVTLIRGNAPDYVKQLMCNTFYGYGVGEGDAFGSTVGHSVMFKEISIDRQLEKQGRFEAVTVAELLVTKRK